MPKIDLRDRISLRRLDLVRFDIPDRLVWDELALDGEDGLRLEARNGGRQETGSD